MVAGWTNRTDSVLVVGVRTGTGVSALVAVPGRGARSAVGACAYTALTGVVALRTDLLADIVVAQVAGTGVS